MSGGSKREVFAGKGLPSEIEREALKSFSRNNKTLKNYSSLNVRLYMIMMNLGIDCSGFVSRVIQSLFEEKGIDFKKNLKPEKSLLNPVRYFFRPLANLSAKALTSLDNCIKIADLNEVLPGDLIKVGDSHLTVISGVSKTKGKTQKIEYYHSTSDYFERHGVRKGEIKITTGNDCLEKQTWEEDYRGHNFMLEDYKNSPHSKRGIRRLKALSKVTRGK